MLPCFGAFFYVAARCFSRCLIFWCFWIKPKARKKESKRIFFSIDPSGNNPAPPIVRLLQGADLPPFVTKRWCQKCPPGEKLRETHSASLKRAPVAGLQANRPRFLTLRLHAVLLPLQAIMRNTSRRETRRITPVYSHIYLLIYDCSASTYSAKASRPASVMRHTVQGILPRKVFSTSM